MNRWRNLLRIQWYTICRDLTSLSVFYFQEGGLTLLKKQVPQAKKPWLITLKLLTAATNAVHVWNRLRTARSALRSCSKIGQYSAQTTKQAVERSKWPTKTNVFVKHRQDKYIWQNTISPKKCKLILYDMFNTHLSNLLPWALTH